MLRGIASGHNKFHCQGILGELNVALELISCQQKTNTFCFPTIYHNVIDCTVLQCVFNVPTFLNFIARWNLLWHGHRLNMESSPNIGISLPVRASHIPSHPHSFCFIITTTIICQNKSEWCWGKPEHDFFLKLLIRLKMFWFILIWKTPVRC